MPQWPCCSLEAISQSMPYLAWSCMLHFDNTHGLNACGVASSLEVSGNGLHSPFRLNATSVMVGQTQCLRSFMHV